MPHPDPKLTPPSSGRARPLAQFSLQGLLVVTAMVAVLLGVYRGMGIEAMMHYLLLLFVVGPWFSHLAGECLPIRSGGLRKSASHLFLLVLFIATLRMAEYLYEGPVALYLGLAALVLWTPQYFLFFLHIAR